MTNVDLPTPKPPATTILTGILPGDAVGSEVADTVEHPFQETSVGLCGDGRVEHDGTVFDEIGDQHALFQPAHGSAPDIMGKDQANPLAAILSAALMLDYLGERSDDASLVDAGRLIENAVQQGFEQNRLRPVEFGGDQGTRALTQELVALMSTASA